MPIPQTLRRPGAALLALAAGLAAALAHPPFGVLPGLIGYALAMGLIERASGDAPLRSAFWRGWLFGLGYFSVGVWWVSEAFMVDAANQGWMAPFAVTLLAGGLALFWGLAALAYRRLAPAGAERLLVFAGLFALAEWLRGHLGFPWDLPGETWRAGSAPSQAAALLGAYGLTWLTLAIAAAPALLVGPRRDRWSIAAVACALAALAGLYVGGSIRLWRAEPNPTEGLRVRVVQPDIPQAAKYDEAFFRDIVSRYVGLTAQPAARRPDVVIWPEGAIPAAVEDYLAPQTWTRAAIMTALSPGQALIFGGYHVEGSVERPIYRNSLFVARRDEDLRIVGVYDKYKLVPFGEFTPFSALLEPIGFKKLVHVGDDFTAGPPPRPLSAAGLPVLQPLICYESLFPGFAKATPGAPPAWIVNISNDAWFGRTSGPPQHLNLASYRAIEQGIPMVRATPTGVSAVIDAYGRVGADAKLKLGQRGVIDAILPRPASRTPYSRIGDTLFWLLMAVSISLAVRHMVRNNIST